MARYEEMKETTWDLDKRKMLEHREREREREREITKRGPFCNMIAIINCFITFLDAKIIVGLCSQPCTFVCRDVRG